MTHQPLKKKIGQLFIIGFEGTALSKNNPVIADIVERNLGGVILFDRLLAKKRNTNNIISPGQVADLTSRLQELAGGNLLIAVDQEGGRVARLNEQHGFTTIPDAATLGRRGDPEQTGHYGEQVAEILHSVGINFNLAPIVDLDVFPENPIIGAYGRSFSNNPDAVFKHTVKWLDAHRKKGVLSCLKHFPGHGSSINDSHLGFVDISSTWNEVELQPYKDLLARGYKEAIMAGHLYNSRFDKSYPATLSHTTLDGILRKRLGHNGVIISDDMQMRAITDRYGLAESCCRAISAGVDLLIIGNNLSYEPEIMKETLDTILKAVDEGQLTQRRIEEAWSRVQQLKKLLKGTFKKRNIHE
ncbi:MAG: glycoside hydrolase family 3 protein [Deltaproteobacteria bacterium]|nr:glycoside hydrolase family 3 protein [Deltaproteobacteria bacterium]